MEIAQKGFSCTGIYPLNRDIFTDLDFLPSQITEIKQLNSKNGEQRDTSNNEDLIVIPTHENNNEDLIIMPIKENESIPGQIDSVEVEIHQTPSCSRDWPKSPGEVLTPSARGFAIPKTPSCQQQTTEFTSEPFSPESRKAIHILKEISPVPNCSEKRLHTRKRRSERSEILTSSPFKTALEEKQTIQVAKATRVKAKRAAKKVKFDAKENVDEQKKITSNSKEQQKINITKYKKRNSLNKNTNAKVEVDNEETTCLICDETFDDDWIQCGNCKKWAHEGCADLS